MAKNESKTASAVNDKIQNLLIIAYDANKGELLYGEDISARVTHNEGENIIKVEEHIVTRDGDGNIVRRKISKDRTER